MIKQKSPFVNRIYLPHSIKEGVEVPETDGVRVPPYDNHRKMNLLQVAAIKVLREAGWTTKQIAYVLKKTQRAVEKSLENPLYFPPPEPTSQYFDDNMELPTSHKQLEDNEGRL